MYSFQVAVCCGIALPAGLLTSWCGPKHTAVFGAILATLGWLVAGLAYLYTACGLLLLVLGQVIFVGGGYGIMYVAALQGLNQEFTNSRGHGTANGLATSGSGAGQAGLVALLHYSLEGLGLELSYMFVLPVLCLVCGLLGLCFLPGKITAAEVVEAPSTEVVVVHAPSDMEDSAEDEGASDVEVSPTVNREAGEASSLDNMGLPGVIRSKILDRKIASHKMHMVFLCAAFADFCAVNALYLPYNFLFPLARSANFTSSQTHLLLLPIGAGSFFGRVLAGKLCSCFTGHPRFPLNFTIVALALASSLPALMTTFLSPASLNLTWSFCFFLGLFTGAWIAATSPLLVSLLGQDLLDSAFCRLTVLRGLAALLGPNIAYALSTNSPKLPFYLGSGCFFAAACLFFLAQRMYIRRSS